jgi:hypothetical protein
LLAEACTLQLFEETTEATARATGASEHLPEQITEAAAARCRAGLSPRTASRPAVRQHTEHDRHQRHEHLARARAAPGPRRWRVGAAAHPLSGQSPEKVVENPHKNLL